MQTAIFTLPLVNYRMQGIMAQVQRGWGRACAVDYYDQRLKSSAALVPPKPKEFESAYSTEALRAGSGT